MRRFGWLMFAGLVLGSGCHFPVRQNVDQQLCERAEMPLDPEPLPPPRAKPAEKPKPLGEASTLSERLQLPPTLPGAKVPDIKLPPATAPKKEIEAAFQSYFPPLPGLPEVPKVEPGPGGMALTLADLQKLALTNNPVLRQASADVEAARGFAVQAGLYPNPSVGYLSQSAGPGGGPIMGGFIGQSFKTPGKLRLAQMSALFDLQIAENKLKQVDAEVRTQVRTAYFDVLVARETLRVHQETAHFTDEIYKVMVLQLKGGEVAAYEPMQVRVLALQARALNVQAHNRFLASWKQLAAAIGLPGMPLTELAGRVDAPIPRYQYDKVLAHVLLNHTEVQTAVRILQKADTDLRQARLQPYPDTDVMVAIQHDASPPGPAKTIANVQVGIPVPVWNRNQGSIRQAQANLVRAQAEAHRARTDLSARVAQAFERYENARVLVALYTREILPNQVQAFRAAVLRHARGSDKGISYNDLVTAEQSLVNLIVTYLGTLREQWSAVAEVGGLLQTDDLFQIDEEDTVAPLPDLSQLMCVGEPAPCSPLTDPALRGADGYWPPAVLMPPMTPAPKTQKETLQPPRPLPPQVNARPEIMPLQPTPIVIPGKGDLELPALTPAPR